MSLLFLHVQIEGLLLLLVLEKLATLNLRFIIQVTFGWGPIKAVVIGY